jgi:hypothetical protein
MLKHPQFDALKFVHYLNLEWLGEAVLCWSAEHDIPLAEKSVNSTGYSTLHYMPPFFPNYQMQYTVHTSCLNMVSPN